MTSYPNPSHRTLSDSHRRQLKAVKDASRIEQLVHDYGEFKLLGDGRLLGRCVSPGHEDKTPSMHIYSETQTFKCFGIGCGAQGDVLDFVMLVEDCELWEAMMLLATRHGIEMPERPRSWFARQERQRPVREALKDALARRVQRRLYRWILAPALANIADEDERLVEAGHAWEDAGKIARQIVARAGGA